MLFTLWFLVIGVLLVTMALVGSLVERLPLTPSILYVALGYGLGPYGFGLMQPDALRDAMLLERLSEVVVIISLFVAGLKLRTPLSDGRWRLPVRLATVSMLITVGLIALTGTMLLSLPLGAAILLGAILAPTDPVLASDVQVERPTDRDRLRFALTGEAGLNDGAAFPFVMLGLGLLGLHELGSFGWRWLAIDVVWAVIAGLLIGWFAGLLVGQLVLYLRREHKEAVGLDDFLSLGLIALAYGLALLLSAYGFLAVFAAGLALRRVEMRHTGEQPQPDFEESTAVVPRSMATDPEHAPAYMATVVLGFNEQLERIGAVGVMVLVGGLLSPDLLSIQTLWFVPLLLLVIRPAAVAVGLFSSASARFQRQLIGWFGIRGVGSIYYLMYAIEHGLPEHLAQPLLALTLTTIAVSVVVHGISVTPLMRRYRQAIQHDEHPAVDPATVD